MLQYTCKCGQVADIPEAPIHKLGFQATLNLGSTPANRIPHIVCGKIKVEFMTLYDEQVEVRFSCSRCGRRKQYGFNSYKTS